MAQASDRSLTPCVGVPVKWILSQGSDRALEFLNSGSVDFGSTAGLPAVLSKANGNPIKSV